MAFARTKRPHPEPERRPPARRDAAATLGTRRAGGRRSPAQVHGKLLQLFGRALGSGTDESAGPSSVAATTEGEQAGRTPNASRYSGAPAWRASVWSAGKACSRFWPQVHVEETVRR